jgi:hypothetical protein
MRAFKIVKAVAIPGDYNLERLYRKFANGTHCNVNAQAVANEFFTYAKEVFEIDIKRSDKAEA